jgi:hypothetical protein
MQSGGLVASSPRPGCTSSLYVHCILFITPTKGQGMVTLCDGRTFNFVARKKRNEVMQSLDSCKVIQVQVMWGAFAGT